MNLVPHYLREIAVLVEPLTIAEKAEHQLYGLMQRRPPWIDPAVSERRQGRGHTALVLGAGPVGLLGAMALRSAEFETFIYSRSTNQIHALRSRKPLARPTFRARRFRRLSLKHTLGRSIWSMRRSDIPCSRWKCFVPWDPMGSMC